MQIAMVLPEVKVFSGGVKRELKFLEYSAGEGVNFTVFTPRTERYEETSWNILQALYQKKIFDLEYSNSARGSMKRDFDLVIIPTEYWLRPFFVAKRLGLQGPRGIILQLLPWIHSLDVFKTINNKEIRASNFLHLPALLQSKFGYSIGNSVSRSAFGLIYIQTLKSFPNCFTATSIAMERQLHEMNISNLYILDPMYGVDGSAVQKAKEEHKAEILYDAIYSGRCVPEKGFFDLLKVVYVAKKILRKDIKIAICGIIQEKKYVEPFWENVKQLNLAGNIQFLGQLNQTNLFKTTIRSKLLLCPSYTDSFSLAIAETLSLGVPIIAYDTDAVKYEWASSKAVSRIKVGDYKTMGITMAKLLKEDDANEYRIAAQKDSSRIIQKYSWEKAIKAERGFYEWVMKSSN